MWKIQVINNNSGEIVKFLNRTGLSRNDFLILPVSGHPEQIELLYQEREPRSLPSYASWCQEDVLRDQWP